MSEIAAAFGNYTCAWQMPPKSGRRKYKGPGRAPASARSAALGPPSGDATPDNDGEDGSHDDAGFDSAQGGRTAGGYFVGPVLVTGQGGAP